MRSQLSTKITAFLGGVAMLAAAPWLIAWTPLPVDEDPLIRMPGSQRGAVSLDASSTCLPCHDHYDAATAPGTAWRGGMMSNAVRDPFFWAAVTVAAQDSIWALGRPNAADLCIRCHSPGGWLGGRSEPVNGSALTGDDFDGVSCESCHRAFDPFFEDAATGARESAEWTTYWDESGASGTPASAAAATTLDEDRAASKNISLFSGEAFFDGTNRPVSADYDEAGGGQLFVDLDGERRGPFADHDARHKSLYSRFHRSRYFCATCHDVSNPVSVNQICEGMPAGPCEVRLPSEELPAYAYGHVERTFSEFSLSDYGQLGGAAGRGAFAPGTLTTSRPGDVIAACQDCHMRDVVGRGSAFRTSPLRPDESVEHPGTGVPRHDQMGGNVLVTRLLASTIPGSDNYDATNEALLAGRASELTMDLEAGVGLDAEALLAASDRALANLHTAAVIEELTYDPATGALSFRIRNDTGHKLLSGYPEGRRMFANVKVWSGARLLWEVNPYDEAAGTLRGLDGGYSPASPALGASEEYVDALVYEVHTASSALGGAQSFHFVLADSQLKDNRIPPRGYRIGDAAARSCLPAWEGVEDPDLFTAEEYAGGYDQVDLAVASGGDRVEVTLYYQTISREYAEFLTDELTGAGATLPSPTPSGEAEAYIVETDPWFAGLAGWGTTVWDLWDHNRDVPGIAPIQMTLATWTDAGSPCAGAGSDGDPCDDGDACTTDDVCSGGACVGGAPVSCPDVGACRQPGVCDPETGRCDAAPVEAGTACDDGDECTEGETCDGAGGCSGGADVCGADADADGDVDADGDADADADADGDGYADADGDSDGDGDGDADGDTDADGDGDGDADGDGDGDADGDADDDDGDGEEGCGCRAVRRGPAMTLSRLLDVRR